MSSLCSEIVFFILPRNRNERFYMSGMLLVGLIEQCSSVLAQVSGRSRGGNQNQRRNVHAAAMAQVSRDAMELRRTLLVVSKQSIPKSPTKLPFATNTNTV